MPTKHERSDFNVRVLYLLGSFWPYDPFFTSWVFFRSRFPAVFFLPGRKKALKHKASGLCIQDFYAAVPALAFAACRASSFRRVRVVINPMTGKASSSTLITSTTHGAGNRAISSRLAATWSTR